MERERVAIIERLHKPGRRDWMRIRGEIQGQQEPELRLPDFLFSASFTITSLPHCCQFGLLVRT